MGFDEDSPDDNNIPATDGVNRSVDGEGEATEMGLCPAEHRGAGSRTSANNHLLSIQAGVLSVAYIRWLRPVRATYVVPTRHDR